MDGGLSSLGGWVLGGLSGAATATLAIAGATALTALYLLRLRRRRVLVPFAPLWTAAPGERRSESWARRLRRLLSLLLQVAFFGLVLLAAADPRPAADAPGGRSVVVLIDRSASMSAVEGGTTRLALARDRAREIVAGLRGADRALVAAFAAETEAETGFDADRERLARAVDRITPSTEPAELGRALELATAVLRDRPRPTIVLVSDGAFSDDARAQGRLPDGVDLRFAPVGTPASDGANNVAVLELGARRYPADPTSVEAAATVQSFRATPCEVTLEITAGPDRVPVERARLRLGPRARVRHVLADVAAPDARLEARLVDARDELPSDDHAFAVVPGAPRARVLRIGAGPNLYLDGVFLALGDAVMVRRVSAADAERTRPEWPRYDLVVFDGVAPSPPPATGRYLYLDPHGPGSPFAERGMVREPIITDAKRAHPLLRHVSLIDLNVAEARRLMTAAGDEVVASALGAPLVLARTRPGLRVAALAFDVRRSDLPMRSAFPLLVSNAVGWLVGSDTPDPLALRTGARARVPLPSGAATARVTDPAGVATTRPAFGGALELAPPMPGFYEIRASGTAPALVLAANLASAVESNTRPVRTLSIAGRTLAPPDPPAGRRGSEPWVLALVLAVGLSLAEWWSYHRRWTV